LAYPRGGREIVSRKRKDNRKNKIVEEEKIVDGEFSGEKDSLEKLFCVAGKNFFVNSRRTVLGV